MAAGNVAVLFVVCFSAINIYGSRQSISKLISKQQQAPPLIFSTTHQSTDDTNEE
jgi:hypothetical protein